MSKKNDSPQNGVPNDQSQEQNQIIEELKQVKEDFKEELKNTKDFKRFKQAVVTFQGSLDNNAEEVKKLEEQLSDTQKLINDSLQIQLKETNKNFKELINQRQNNGELQREIEKWQDFAVDFFDNLERISSELPDDKDNKVFEKVIEDFNGSVNNLGLERIIPSKGDDLKEELYEVEETKESENVESGKVIECTKWGYKLNGKLYKGKRAKVFIAKPIIEKYQEKNE